MAAAVLQTSLYNKLFSEFQYLFEPGLIKEFCDFGLLIQFAKDIVLIEEGDVITDIPLVLNGAIKILSVDQFDNSLLLYYLEHGDTCAVSLKCCSSGAKSKIRASAAVETEVLYMPAYKMDEWMARYKSWRDFVLQTYNSGMDDLFSAAGSLAFESLEIRLQKYLRDKVMVTKKSRLKITHYEISRDMNSSRVVISRLMKKLEQEGKVQISRNYIDVIEFSRKK